MSESIQNGSGRLQQTGETAKDQASATADQARQAAGQVTSTAAEQAKVVAGEARQQATTVIDDLRSRVVKEAEGQARRAAGTLRQWSDDVAGLADRAQSDSPARSLAAQAADRGHQAADYLEKQGVEGVVSHLRDFARRRPGAFLGGAVLAGLAAGRLAKAAGKAQQSSGTGQQRSAGTALPEAVNEPAAPTLPAGPEQDAPPVPPVPPDIAQAPPAPAPPPVPPTAGTAPSGEPVRPYPEV
jgi:vacuolar-type H+-ATPase subunit H